jgi:uncharacterized protein
MARTLRLSASFVVLVVVATASLYLIQAPSPFLLGGLIGGAVFSLVGRSPWTFPDPARHLGIALIGVGAGALIDSGVIRRIAGSPVEILGGVFITVVFSLLTGLLLLLSPHVNPPTAMLSSLATRGPTTRSCQPFSTHASYSSSSPWPSSRHCSVAPSRRRPPT